MKSQISNVAGRQHLPSTSQRKLIVPRYRLDSYVRRCFAVAGPSTWNSLPDSLNVTQHRVSAFSGIMWKVIFLRNFDEMHFTH